MELKQYQLKISIFITSIIFFIFSLMGILFFLYKNWVEYTYINNKLIQTEKNLTNLSEKKFNKILNKLNEINIMYIVSSAVPSEKNQFNNNIKKLIGVPFINIFKNNSLIFTNFNYKKCGIYYTCKAVTYKNYKFILAFKKNLFSYYLIIQILIISLLSSIIIFPFILFTVKNLTKPIKENIEFMKNFINTVGHEIKTPLTNINLSAQILLNQGFNKKLIVNIEKESKHLSRIIDSLLELTSITKYNKKSNTNLKDITEKILEKYTKEKFITMLENTIKKINQIHFEILFENLIKNAIKYKSESPIIITLNSNYLEIKNKTTHIPNFNKIFDLFYKENVKSGGYGIGLTIVRKICEVNKWKIKNTSKNDIFGIRIIF